MKRVLVLLLAIVAGGFLSVGCLDSANSKQKEATKLLMKQAHQQIGMPNIVNFTERKFAKLIYELRDEGVATYSYFMDLKGGLHFLCDSIGYGLPYSVQYTNPEVWGYDGGTIPQADPNGLFMPQGLDATFVLCSDGNGGVKPVYSEPSLIVSPFPLKAVSRLH